MDIYTSKSISIDILKDFKKVNHLSFNLTQLKTIE